MADAMTDERAVTSTSDGSAGDANYGAIGTGYAQYRRPEPAFVMAIHAALGDARTLVNVGAGAGSYEPTGLDVTAVEPSATMRAQRPAGSAMVVDATAENLPFGDDTFDAALASFTVHQWRDLPAGLHEVRRVTRGPVVILTCDPAALTRSWINDYAPEVIATEASRYPAVDALRAGLGEPSPWSRFRSRSDAWTGSVRRTTAAPRRSSTQERGG
ncbi:class I SAM-dependent methyltransferase [Curtobacterium sp. ME12]|uniref:class I SAM-dependent methyltransferase n=1 Tax=Curtobacterium sp. ME12 TaxID=2744253 RepID=UPI002174D494|nr:class I SAM-dependent methyltransferase [Curtobacterium sp. ME12]